MAQILLQTAINTNLIVFQLHALWTVCEHLYLRRRKVLYRLVFMNKNALIVAVIFLAAALVTPIYVLYTETTSTLRNYLQEIPNLSGHDTETQAFINAETTRQATLFGVLFVVEVVLVALFAVSMWYAIRCAKADQCRTFPTP